ncbi:hypothetical protein JYQ62_04270 [Nostoc sp. UHCC 0702]|nr:hypothetical protein JYQ62_04270 [Nostoc sp. UHCC 0702]
MYFEVGGRPFSITASLCKSQSDRAEVRIVEYTSLNHFEQCDRNAHKFTIIAL